MTDNTLLAFAEIAIPPYSARGITQTLTLIDQASQARRTVNGNLTGVAIIGRKIEMTGTTFLLPKKTPPNAPDFQTASG